MNSFTSCPPDKTKVKALLSNFCRTYLNLRASMYVHVCIFSGECHDRVYINLLKRVERTTIKMMKGSKHFSYAGDRLKQ